MPLAGAHVLIGLLVGILVGLTGVGGGVILLPILIFGLRVPALTAVGSDAVFNAITKLGAGYFHWRARTVSRRLVAALCCGSLPGAWVGVHVLDYLRREMGNGVNHFLTVFIGALLVGITLLLFFEDKIARFFTVQKLRPAEVVAKAAVIGLFAGVLVGMSSVGSGSIVMVLLLLFVQCHPQSLVGTDLVHAIILTGFTGILQFHLGNVNLLLVAELLIGSVPGALIGVKLSSRLPGPWLRRVLCAVLLLTGIRMLGA
ncbi:MAG: sulfite exporter TauE/SafE family protein [Terriglobia bacterium]